MSRSRLALASVAVVTVLCLVGVSILAVAAGGSALAYKVNGTQTSQQTIDAQLHDLANAKATKSVSQTPGSVGSATTAQLLTTNIVRDLLRQAADEKGVKLTAADRTAGLASAQSQLGANFSGLPESYRNLLTELYGYANALGVSDSNALAALLNSRLAKADVYVNPRYGFWNPKRGVCPPTGCAAAGSSSSGG